MDAIIIKTVVAGIVATSFMTAFMYLLSYLYNKQWRVIHLLGTMVLNKTSRIGEPSNATYVVVAGSFLHYAVGIAFSFLYRYLLQRDLTTVTLVGSQIFGAIAGVSAVMKWRTFFFIHKNPPRVPLAGYLAAIFAGHLVFAAALMYTYKLL